MGRYFERGIMKKESSIARFAYEEKRAGIGDEWDNIILSKEEFVKMMRANDATDIFKGCADAEFFAESGVWFGNIQKCFALETDAQRIEAVVFGTYKCTEDHIYPVIGYIYLEKDSKKEDNWITRGHLQWFIGREQAECRVNFLADDWETQLERDMIEKLFLLPHNV